jgi:hypothetical protein
MATRIYNETPAYNADNSGSMGTFLGILLLLAFFLILFFYGLPLLRNATSGPQINVPSQLDVNVRQQ